ncbi:MAG: tRNA uridine-5-carboxymethylaminomethyl(34) synthesis GTPase MnmE, partial [Synechococcaceae bacterium WB6_1B_055]|nr:tRNA uridine-5-carboxymethylaminomethyl(34) synthesis GTPase MnmE [Synechococcaceae bacterium WB6_1B_055]
MNNSNSTIAAVATAIAPGEGSVAIVRISGPKAEAIGKQLFVCAGHQEWESHRVLYGHVVEPSSGERIDEALLLLMRAPRSFTRETIVELHCHGGVVVVQRVLDLVLAAGAERAKAGEFSQRAFLNGRLDLTRAEALIDLITARSERAAQLAMAGLSGGVQGKIEALRQRLLDQLAELEARVDFEEDLPSLNPQTVTAELKNVAEEMQLLLTAANQGQMLREGLRVAIVGQPNVGKSSLLNRLCGNERAIVSDQAGTTRDLLDIELVIEGVPITLLDTAGIRASEDKVEQLGIERSRRALTNADVVILMFNINAGWSSADENLKLEIPKGIPLLLVGNKIDLGKADCNKLNAINALEISAEKGIGINNLKKQLLLSCGYCLDNSGIQPALNRRQQDLTKAAAKALDGCFAAQQ